MKIPRPNSEFGGDGGESGSLCYRLQSNSHVQLPRAIPRRSPRAHSRPSFSLPKPLYNH